MRKISMPDSRGVLHEPGDDVVGIVRVADRVRRRGTASGSRCSAPSRAGGAGAPTGLRCRKRIAVSKVAPPHISSEKSSACDAPRASATASMSIGAHARGHERLVRVAQRRVGDEQRASARDPLGEFLRARVRAADGACPAAMPAFRSNAGTRAGGSDLGRPVALRVRVAVDDDVAEVS